MGGGKKSIIIILVALLLLGTGLALIACKSKKTSKIGDDNNSDNFIAAPQSAELKTPLVAVSFSHTPTFTIRQVVEGDTIRLFKSADCAEDTLLGSGVVEAGQTTVDITTDSLSSLGTYQIYANRTNAAGETSACSPRLTSYQLIGCPDGLYAHVEGNPEFGTDSFCVMVTEAKKGGENIPVSQYDGNPWGNISPNNAKAACKNIVVEHGSCDIISVMQWMTIAWDLEATDANWSLGTVGSGTLNRGHSDNNPGSALSISDSTDGWDQTGNDASSWTQKRTFILSNGEVLWDFAGNLGEWADWETGGDTFDIGPNTCPHAGVSPYNVDCPELDPKTYYPGNPAGIPQADYNSNVYNLGKIIGTSEENREAGLGGAAFRGGGWGNGVSAGIFQLHLQFHPNYATPGIGFRCVCTVTGE